MLEWDYAWGALLVTLSVTALAGNSVSMLYFARMRQKRTVHDDLYCVMCGVDLVSAVNCWPVVLELFCGRGEVFFSSVVFCGIWSIAFKAATIMALFVVMLISVSRTMSIIWPFHKLNRRLILWSVALYLVLDLSVMVLLYVLKVIHFLYYQDYAYCTLAPRNFRRKQHLRIIWDYFFYPFSFLQTYGAMFLVLASFVVSVVALLERAKVARAANRSERKIWKFSVTIAAFTGIYLLCNLPSSVIRLLTHCISWLGLPDYFGLDSFLGWNYSVPFYVMLPVLNAALNPILYYLRMPKYKLWAEEIVASVMKGEFYKQLQNGRKRASLSTMSQRISQGRVSREAYG